MGFWSKLTGKADEFEFSNDPPSDNLENALRQASEDPLNDLTWRMVLATPNRSWIFDITLFQADAGFTAYERGGRQLARTNAASIVAEAIMGRKIEEGQLASALLAFFDTDFTVGANKGKTHETAWNTLALDVQHRNGNSYYTRSAHRLTFPVGRLSLDFMETLKIFNQ
jgi:hypothetical protein